MEKGVYFNFHEEFDAIPLIFDDKKGFFVCIKPKYRSLWCENTQTRGLFFRRTVKIHEKVQFPNEGTVYEGNGHRIILIKIKYGRIADCEHDPDIAVDIATFGPYNENLKVKIYWKGSLRQISTYQPQTVLYEEDMCNGHWTHYLATEK